MPDVDRIAELEARVKTLERQMDSLANGSLTMEVLGGMPPAGHTLKWTEFDDAMGTRNQTRSGLGT